MKKDFLSKFNEQTDNAYSFLKLVSVDVFLRKRQVVINLIYPESHSKIVLSEKEAIEKAVKKSLPLNSEVFVKLVLSHFDKEHFLINLKKLILKFPAITSTMNDDDIVVCDDIDNRSVQLKLLPHIFQYCEDSGVFKSIKQYLKLNYCDEIKTCFELKSECLDIDDSFEGEALPQIVLENDSGRYITPQNVEEFVGKIIYEKAVYIEDATKPKEGLVVCGTLAVFDECQKKSDNTKKYYRIAIEDFTGRLSNCIYFPSKFTMDKIAMLKAGKSVVLRGNLEEDKFRPGQLSYMIKDISLCTLPDNFKVNRLRRVVSDSYQCVQPKPYEKKYQASLFDEVKSPTIPEFLLGKTFCVFDIETTGLSPSESKIIEIAAVKIVNGIFVETFSTFVDPQVPIPARITNLTGIVDADVKGMPLIEDVLPDFYKFCEGATLVGHNAKTFDLPFVSFHARPLKIYFDNKILDTLDLSRKHFPGIRNYKLETLVKFFEVEHENAHRAIDDTIATAEVFVKIAQKMQQSA